MAMESDIVMDLIQDMIAAKMDSSAIADTLGMPTTALEGIAFLLTVGKNNFFVPHLTRTRAYSQATP